MDEKYFTLYWIGGRREIIKGQSIEDAFTKQGYGLGAVKAIDWYDNGVVDTHYFVKNIGWEKRIPIEISLDDFNNNYFKERVVENFKTSHSFQVVLPNKSKVIIEQVIGDYATIGYVKHIQICYLEYHTGGYCEDSEEDHHFMVCDSVNREADKVEEAVDAFYQYINHLFDDKIKIPLSIPLEEIQKTQQL